MLREWPGARDANAHNGQNSAQQQKERENQGRLVAVDLVVGGVRASLGNQRDGQHDAREVHKHLWAGMGTVRGRGVWWALPEVGHGLGAVGVGQVANASTQARCVEQREPDQGKGGAWRRADPLSAERGSGVFCLF